MRRRALIMAVLLVAPLALLGGSRRPVFLLRPSPGLRRRFRFSAPNPPPRVQGGGYFLACRAGVAFSLRPFLVSAPSLRPARLGLAAAAPAARSPSAGALVQLWPFVARAPWFLLPTSPVRRRTFRQSGRKVATSRPFLALLPAVHSPRLGAYADVSRQRPQGSPSRGSHSPCSPRCKSTCKPPHGNRAA